MIKLNLKIIFIISLLLIFIIASSYVIGVGIIGGASFSYNASAWVSFSSYFNNMLSPVLASIAAAIAFFSLTRQLSSARKDASLNEQISNYLNHINLLQKMIEKKWKTIISISNIDWEVEPFNFINKENIKDRLENESHLPQEAIRLFRLFEDLVDAMQWYTYLHKEKIDLYKGSHPKNEWSHFSASLIQEQDKKMKFCYEYCLWLIQEKAVQTARYNKELLIYSQFYENLIQSGTLNEI